MTEHIIFLTDVLPWFPAEQLSRSQPHDLSNWIPDCSISPVTIWWFQISLALWKPFLWLERLTKNYLCSGAPSHPSQNFAILLDTPQSAPASITGVYVKHSCRSQWTVQTLLVFYWHPQYKPLVSRAPPQNVHQLSNCLHTSQKQKTHYY